jgi:hypothetical protein
LPVQVVVGAAPGGPDRAVGLHENPKSGAETGVTTMQLLTGPKQADDVPAATTLYA